MGKGKRLRAKQPSTRQSSPSRTEIVCDGCGRRWALASGVGWSTNNGDLNVAAIKVGPCPHCGGEGTVQDLQFGSVGAMRAAGSTDQMVLELLQQLRDDLNSGEVTAPEAIEAIAGNPSTAQFAMILRRAKASAGLVVAVLSLLISALALSDQLTDGDNRGVEERLDRLIDVVEDLVTREGLAPGLGGATDGTLGSDT